MLYTNIKLYGNEYIDNDIKYSYFDLSLYKSEILINTWKNIVFNKTHNKTRNNIKIKRYENILWRTWFMKQNNKHKIKFNTNINYINVLKGPILILDSI
jgi:hypothetical protein